MGGAVRHPPEMAGLDELSLPKVLPEVLDVPPTADRRVGIYPDIVINPTGIGDVCGNKNSAIEVVQTVADPPVHVEFGVSVYFYAPRAFCVEPRSPLRGPGWHVALVDREVGYLQL